MKLSGEVGVFAFDRRKSTCHNMTVQTLKECYTVKNVTQKIFLYGKFSLHSISLSLKNYIAVMGHCKYPST